DGRAERDGGPGLVLERLQAQPHVQPGEERPPGEERTRCHGRDPFASLTCPLTARLPGRIAVRRFSQPVSRKVRKKLGELVGGGASVDSPEGGRGPGRRPRGCKERGGVAWRDGAGGRGRKAPAAHSLQPVGLLCGGRGE